MTGALTIPHEFADRPAPKADAQAEPYFDLRAALAALDSGAPVTFPPMMITRARIGGRDLVICTNYEKDPIQRTLRGGAFYEAADLHEVAKFLPPQARVLDVGANIGNHALYFSTQCGAASVIVVEPNPVALAPLVANIVLNDLGGIIRTEALGIGLGARSRTGMTMSSRDHNLGGARMMGDPQGQLEIHPGDALFADESFDLLKIDVEGMEMRVLAGLEQTIARCRPLIFIEVDEANATAFADWCAAQSYVPRYEVQRYAANRNYLLQPIGDRS